MDLFTTKFIPCNPAALLNYPGAEVLLVPSKHSVESEIGEHDEQILASHAEEVLKTVQGREESGFKEEDQDEIDSDRGHEAALKIVRDLGLEGLIEGKALEGHWE